MRRKCNGAKRYTEATNREMVGERSVSQRTMTEKTWGGIRSENVGISSESEVRIFAVENLRFPGQGSSSQGKSGPKARLKSVVDGQQV